jgi:hypothetical protein
MKKRWFASKEDGGKSHRVCRKCHQIIRRHDRWRQIRRRYLGIFATVYEIEHRDCDDPQLAKAKLLSQPEPPISQWLREQQLPPTTWTGSSEKTETIQ